MKVSLNKFPFYRQADAKDCGPTCIKIISKYYGKNFSLELIRELSETNREGSNLLSLSHAAEKIGFNTLGVQIDLNTLIEEVPLPCIIYWNKIHFVVLYKISRKGKDILFHISDPSFGLITYKKNEFLKLWIGSAATEETEEGVVLILEPTPFFYNNEPDEEVDNKNLGISFLFKYILKYKKLIFQLLLGLFVGSALSLIFPFLTQSIVDIGIKTKDLNFIYIVFVAQIFLFLGKVSIDVIRSWILLHLSTRINISIISDFFLKLMNLPIGFFDTRITGDIMQRINDHHRIEQLLTNTSLNTIFAFFNLLIFSIILLIYNKFLFLLYLGGAFCYVVWVLFFLKKRKEIDYKRFSQTSQEQSKVIEIINGMQEIKMHNAETQKRWDWEFIQIKLFKLKIKSLSLEQVQSVGGNVISQIKDIIISFLAAKLVLEGQLTLGMMLSVQYIIGQMNSPLTQFIDFIKQFQDAKISIERLSEIHNKDDEEGKNIQYISTIPPYDIKITNMSFRYAGSEKYIFKNLDLVIPYRKTTAIVGASGSGKTTLLKLLMKFYEPNEGKIEIGSINLKNISNRILRENSGVVMQDGYIFNDSIANNIAIGEENINTKKLIEAVTVANIKKFIEEETPLGYNTRIGNEGIGISGGQKQRLLIARAIYKSPNILLFDEATSSLDANNEKAIMEKLEQFLKDRTAIIIAHRLSTVKKADNIIVLDKGNVVEMGTHDYLVSLKGEYYRLVKNQLELGT